MKCYKVTKSFQGGQGVYYAELPKNKKIKTDSWRDQLESWGEITNGGHSYGYTINAKHCKRPKVIKNRFRLKFYTYYLEKAK